jgi:hypothetical protein
MTNQIPKMYSRPTETSERLTSIRASTHVTALHTKWARLRGEDSALSRGHQKVAAAARRIVGTSDTILIGDLIRAIDALAERCDELTSRLARQEEITAEIAGSLGQDVARLQATISGLHPFVPDA